MDPLVDPVLPLTEERDSKEVDTASNVDCSIDDIGDGSEIAFQK